MKPYDPPKVVSDRPLKPSIKGFVFLGCEGFGATNPSTGRAATCGCGEYNPCDEQTRAAVLFERNRIIAFLRKEPPWKASELADAIQTGEHESEDLEKIGGSVRTDVMGFVNGGLQVEMLPEEDE